MLSTIPLDLWESVTKMMPALSLPMREMQDTENTYLSAACGSVNSCFAHEPLRFFSVQKFF